jgi:hypothetical protein
MRHTQEQLASILNRQRSRGVEDARLHRAFGHGNEALAYPNPSFPNVTARTADEAYRDGWASERRRMNKPDSVCVERFGKGVRHEHG